MDRCQEIITVVFEQFIIDSSTRGYHICHPSFYDPFRLLGIFKLITNGYPVTGLDQLMEISIQGMVRKAGQFSGGGCSVVSSGQRNTQDPGGQNGILTKGFVKITHTEKQDGIRVFLFDSPVLLHHRCVTARCFCHIVQTLSLTAGGATNIIRSHDHPLSGYRLKQAAPDYLCPMRKLSMKELGRKTAEEFRQSEKTPIVVVLENIRSAYNVGSVFRTCDAFLIEAIHIIGYSAKPPHKEIRKTALGAEETVDWKYFKTSLESIGELKSKGFKVYAVEQAENSYKLQSTGFRQKDRVALVFGNEVTGVEQTTIDACDGCIEIPQLGMKHSLNIATAAGVVLWELVRPRIAAPVRGRTEH